MAWISCGEMKRRLLLTASAIGPEAGPWFGAKPVDRYEARSASDQAPHAVRFVAGNIVGVPASLGGAGVAGAGFQTHHPVARRGLRALRE